MGQRKKNETSQRYPLNITRGKSHYNAATSQPEILVALSQDGLVRLIFEKLPKSKVMFPNMIHIACVCEKWDNLSVFAESLWDCRRAEKIIELSQKADLKTNLSRIQNW